VVVAAAGLLDHHEAATHWLASPLLESYGSHASEQRIVEIDRIITCAGHVTALHVALIVTLRVFGPEMVDEVRAGIAASRQAGDVDDRRPFARWRRRREPTAAPRPSNPELVAPDVIAFDEPIVTRAGRSASQGR
jgi:transcriptional regulator GlxA family with amidase domain